jgi:hypothetical protein
VKRLFVIIALAAVPALADDVYLKGGGQITGQIVDHTDAWVTVDIGGGTITAKMSSVVKIDTNESPLQEYRRRAAQIPAGDAEAWRELARWAKSYSLSTQVRQAYREVLKTLPDDEEANTATGAVKLDGKWVTEEESYRARGYVQFEGKWMTPAEQQAILTERQAEQAQAEADRMANEATVAGIEAEQQAEKKRQEEERAKLDANRDTVYWGWGAGPGYWHRPVPQPWPENPASGRR